ncbi:MAG: hypothetical protein WBN17_09000 [Aureibaculum sp.]
MKTKNTKSKMLSVRYLLFLPFLFFTFCQEGSEEIADSPDEVITVESNIVTLMKAAVATKSDDDNNNNDEQCVEFKYPIAFYAYYTNSRTIDTRVINSDEQLFSFFDELINTDQIMIDFPMEIIGEDGGIEIGDMDELVATLEIAVDACRGNDDYDYCDDKNKKVYICHNGHTICVSVNAIKAHLDHGDVLGKCDDDDND